MLLHQPSLPTSGEQAEISPLNRMDVVINTIVFI